MASTAVPSLDALTTARTLIRLIRALDGALKKKGRQDALALTEISTLSAIDRGVILPTAIAREIHADPARVSRVVEHLVCLGFVERHISEEDRRQSPLALTTRGKERLRLARDDIRAVMLTILNALNEEDQVGLTRGLQSVARYLATTEV